MKTKNANTDKLAVLKAGLLFSWVLFLTIASSQELIIETFIFSIIIGIVSYFIFNNKSYQEAKVASYQVKRPQLNNGPQGEQYLKVFFCDSN